MDLKTTYLGLDLKHPIVASSSPLSKNLDGVKRLADAGASAIILFSLFEEQIRQEQDILEFLIGRSTYNSPESISYFPSVADYNAGPADYLELIYKASHSVDVPVIGSLNGVTELGWIEYAKDMVEAGAKAIELNIYFLPVDIGLTGAEVEEQYIHVVQAVRQAVKVPVTVKLSPFFSATANMAKRLVDAGASGLVLFNRFYQPDFDLDNRAVESKLDLSQPPEIRLPLLWISVLYGRLKCSLAATTGVESHVEALKYVLAGADAVYTTSSLLRHGEQQLGKIVQGFRDWMEQNEYESVAQMKGSMSQRNCAEPGAFVRANYIKVLQSFKNPAFSRQT
ncbi:MAG TPA: dihydroorotate dehydrogenase-like protein [Fimbriimonadaceae bacterium]|nr:dihydroorotate dehydrogenase-like protein [Fimbriimonadaceae bacterium]